LHGCCFMNHLSPFRLQYSHAKVSECPKRWIDLGGGEVWIISPV
jgi:hypothetical protein